MRSPLFLVAVAALLACDAPPVEWSDPIGVPQAPGSRLVVDSAGHARFVADALPFVAINAIGVCPNSVRVARAATKLGAAWWGLRADSSAVLYTAASTDAGATWSTPIPVDTADTTTRGCQRPPPGIAASGDDLHIAYSMAASEGTGVFFAHFLASMVHSPVAVIYGDRLVRTAVAADGDRVVVAYEQPNGTRRDVGLAISSSQGHIFESHTDASRDVDAATDPAVALAGVEVAVSWASPQAGDTTLARIVRVGRIH